MENKEDIQYEVNTSTSQYHSISFPSEMKENNNSTVVRSVLAQYERKYLKLWAYQQEILKKERKYSFKGVFNVIQLRLVANIKLGRIYTVFSVEKRAKRQDLHTRMQTKPKVLHGVQIPYLNILKIQRNISREPRWSSLIKINNIYINKQSDSISSIFIDQRQFLSLVIRLGEILCIILDNFKLIIYILSS
ncbi:hypothetical protein QE152_g6664 [Popillia japonica]|uniref:Ribosomal protein S4 n=1 Tax=Popillia japonica TaxID=7064 RepID=A0AAW1MHK7_POPJA